MRKKKAKIDEIDDLMELYAIIMNFDGKQLEEIRKGLEAGVDVSVYAKPEYNWEQMQEIRWGLESGVDVSVYANSFLVRSR